jgi:acetamidase/formamidase
LLTCIEPGELVATKTIDSAGLDEKDVKRSGPFNPLTGPFFVEGAEQGDALVDRLIGYQARFDAVTVAGSMAVCVPKDRLPKQMSAPEAK